MLGSAPSPPPWHRCAWRCRGASDGPRRHPGPARPRAPGPTEKTETVAWGQSWPYLLRHPLLQGLEAVFHAAQALQDCEVLAHAVELGLCPMDGVPQREHHATGHAQQEEHHHEAEHPGAVGNGRQGLHPAAGPGGQWAHLVSPFHTSQFLHEHLPVFLTGDDFTRKAPPFLRAGLIPRAFKQLQRSRIAHETRRFGRSIWTAILFAFERSIDVRILLLQTLTKIARRIALCWLFKITIVILKLL